MVVYHALNCLFHECIHRFVSKSNHKLLQLLTNIGPCRPAEDQSVGPYSQSYGTIPEVENGIACEAQLGKF